LGQVQAGLRKKPKRKTTSVIMQPPNRAAGSLGTFAGVFTPSILTILGIILFLRLGFVVGQSGLGLALVMILLANAISVLTSFSLAAVATNMRVKGGGDYYLISRTLGLEFGGSIGIVLFLAQSVSVGFYLIGFGEALSVLLPPSLWTSPQLLALYALLPLFLLAWLGADWATKFQYVVMACLVLALGSFFLGGSLKWDMSVAVANWTAPAKSLGFWAVFAVFFPAVTGFTQGVSMSGDLKDPGRSLPLGTFAAVGLSMVVYILAAVVLAGSLPANTLQTEYAAMQQVAYGNWLVLIGVIAATLSSAMASFLGAPRILQSLASDRIFPWLLPFAQGVGPMDNPRRGVLLSAVIALGIIGLGQLNAIAPLVSMFFLLSYGLLNYATFYEARSQSPSFRPTFHWYDYRLSLAGALTCLGGMLAISPASGIVAVAILGALYQYLRRTSGPAKWADSQRSYHLQQVRTHLLAAAQESEHPRHWRPQILAFSDNSKRRPQLLHMAQWLEGGSGLTSVVNIIEGTGFKALRERDEQREVLVKDIQAAGSHAFALALTAPDLQIGINILLQSYGVGPLQANTVLLHWLENKGHAGRVSKDPVQNLRTAFRLKHNILMLNAGESKWKTLVDDNDKQLRIDVWWWGEATSRLMLLLAYLLTRDTFWQDATINVLGVKQNKAKDSQGGGLQEVLDNYRVQAESNWVQAEDASQIVKYSADASLIFLPFALRRDEIVDPFGGDLDWLLPRLPVTVLCLAAEDLDLDAEPEEGPAAEAANALHAYEDAQNKQEKMEKEAKRAASAAEALYEELESAKRSGGDEEDLAVKQEAYRESAKLLEQANKKAAKARVKTDQARELAEELGALPSASENGEETDEQSEAS
jgi:amino acid transporter